MVGTQLRQRDAYRIGHEREVVGKREINSPGPPPVELPSGKYRKRANRRTRRREISRWPLKAVK